MWVLLALGLASWIGPAEWVTAGAVPEDQQEAAAQIVGYVFIVGAQIVQIVDRAFRKLEREIFRKLEREIKSKP